MRLDQRRDVELPFCVEAAIRLRHLLAQQPVGSDEFAICQRDRLWGLMLCSLHDDEVVADRVEAIAVDPGPYGIAMGAGAKFFIEHPVAEPLARFDFAGLVPSGQPSSDGDIAFDVDPVFDTPPTGSSTIDAGAIPVRRGADGTGTA